MSGTIYDNNGKRLPYKVRTDDFYTDFKPWGGERGPKQDWPKGYKIPVTSKRKDHPYSYKRVTDIIDGRVIIIEIRGIE